MGRRGRKRKPDPSPGDIIGKWTVIDGERDEHHKILVRCRCLRTRRVYIYALRNGTSTGCQRCANKVSAKALLRVDQGDKYGGWTVVRSVRGAHADVALVCDRDHLITRKLRNVINYEMAPCRRCQPRELGLSRATRVVNYQGRRLPLAAIMRIRGPIEIDATDIRMGETLRDQVEEIIRE